MKSTLMRMMLSAMFLILPILSVGCDTDTDFFEDGEFTNAIYATGDAISQVIVVSALAWGPYIH